MAGPAAGQRQAGHCSPARAARSVCPRAAGAGLSWAAERGRQGELLLPSFAVASLKSHFLPQFQEAGVSVFKCLQLLFRSCESLLFPRPELFFLWWRHSWQPGCPASIRSTERLGPPCTSPAQGPGDARQLGPGEWGAFSWAVQQPSCVWVALHKKTCKKIFRDFLAQVPLAPRRTAEQSKAGPCT